MKKIFLIFISIFLFFGFANSAEVFDYMPKSQQIEYLKEVLESLQKQLERKLKESGRQADYLETRHYDEDFFVVKTLGAEDITEEDAVLEAQYGVYKKNLLVYFAVSKYSSNPSCTSSSHSFFDVDEDYPEIGEIFSLKIEDLEDGEKYYYRACAEDEDEEEVFSGDVKSFYADDKFRNDFDGEMEVNTLGAEEVSSDSAILVGDLQEGEYAWVYFALSRFSGPSCSNSGHRQSVDEKIFLDDGEDFHIFVEDLNRDTRYYYRACAKNTETNDYFSGSIKNFFTDDEESDEEDENIELRYNPYYDFNEINPAFYIEDVDLDSNSDLNSYYGYLNNERVDLELSGPENSFEIENKDADYKEGTNHFYIKDFLENEISNKIYFYYED